MTLHITEASLVASTDDPALFGVENSQLVTTPVVVIVMPLRKIQPRDAEILKFGVYM